MGFAVYSRSEALYFESLRGLILVNSLGFALWSFIEPAEREHGAPLFGKYMQAAVASKLTRFVFLRRQAGRGTC